MGKIILKSLDKPSCECYINEICAGLCRRKPFHQTPHICFRWLFSFKVKLNETANKTHFAPDSWESRPLKFLTVYSFTLVFATFQHVNFPVMENSRSHKPCVSSLVNHVYFSVVKRLHIGDSLCTHPENSDFRATCSAPAVYMGTHHVYLNRWALTDLTKRRFQEGHMWDSCRPNHAQNPKSVLG